MRGGRGQCDSCRLAAIRRAVNKRELGAVACRATLTYTCKLHCIQAATTKMVLQMWTRTAAAISEEKQAQSDPCIPQGSAVKLHTAVQHEVEKQRVPQGHVAASLAIYLLTCAFVQAPS